MNILHRNYQIRAFCDFLCTLKYEQVLKLKEYILKVNDHFEGADTNDSHLHVAIGTTAILVRGFLGTGSYCLDDPNYDERHIDFMIER